MGINRTILRPVAFLAGRHAQRQRRAFLEAHRRTAQVQQELLLRLVRHHSDTAFGRDHGFGGIRSYGDFISAVPIRSYEELRPYMRRVLEGDSNALLPPGERVLMFSLTSGTTGQPKHIPVTQRFANQMRRGWNIWGVTALRDHPSGWLRPILQIYSPMRETTSPVGLPCGAISGLLVQMQKRIVHRMYVVPEAVTTLKDPQTKYYTILRCGVGRDVAMITTANPSSTISMIEVGQAHAERLIRDVADGTTRPPGERPHQIARSLRFKRNRALARRMEAGLHDDGQLLPTHFWRPALLANWTGGTLKLYLPRLSKLFGGVPIRDIGLVASEGRFSLPLKSGTAAGVAEITANFLEFAPANQRQTDRCETLRAHEVEVGREYFLVVTNWAGLWRYDLDDRVRVVDRLGESPVFEFLSRGPHTANITGEKITEHQVVEAMRIASLAGGLAMERFVLQGRFAPRPYYELSLEAPDGSDLEPLADRLDRALSELNIEYHSKRASGRLGAIRPRALPPGTLGQMEDEKIRDRRGRPEQYKHQYLLTDILTEEQSIEHRDPGEVL
ncbi:MAG: GH3 auxin-responsive promoter family protein [Phycisphaerae bacterium]|jgi:hypothetical protein|nr:GH3 auxin-responsive promoter family protein [Phycisphaerae bacterium]